MNDLRSKVNIATLFGPPRKELVELLHEISYFEEITELALRIFHKLDENQVQLKIKEFSDRFDVLRQLPPTKQADDDDDDADNDDATLAALAAVADTVKGWKAADGDGDVANQSGDQPDQPISRETPITPKRSRRRKFKVLSNANGQRWTGYKISKRNRRDVDDNNNRKKPDSIYWY